MKVTKVAHACMIIEERDSVLLIDPGMFGCIPELPKLDIILVTHDHQDHCDTNVIKSLLEKHPNAEVIANNGTGKVLSEAGIFWTPIADGERIDRNGVAIESHGTKHAIIHPDLPMTSQNTGYLIADKLFYPGDALYVPSVPVEVLALPLGGPWMKIAEAIEYAKSINPKIVFPVHDGLYADTAIQFSRFAPRTILTPLGVEFRDMLAGSIEEF